MLLFYFLFTFNVACIYAFTLGTSSSSSSLVSFLSSHHPIIIPPHHYASALSPYNQSIIVANHTLIQRYTEVDPYTRRTRECGNFKSLRNGAISKYCKNHYGSWDRISGVMMPR